MARIKHIAIRTRDIEKTAAFYRQAFGLEQVGLGQNGVYLSDGFINIAILKFQAGENGVPLRLGIDHMGFQVDDVNATVASIKGCGGKSLTERSEVHGGDPSHPQSYYEIKCVGKSLTERSDVHGGDPSHPQSYYEIKCVGPDEQVIDVSSVGWVGANI